MLEKGTYDGKNRFALYMWTSTGSELNLSTANFPLKNLPESSAKFSNDTKRAKSSKTHAFLFLSKTVKLLLRHRSKR